MKTKFGLNQEAVGELAELLEKGLADTYALYINTLNCHWNLEGPRFFFLHEMLQEQYEQLAKNGDEIAERIRQMGRKVPASLSFFSEKSALDPLDETLSTDEMLDALASSHEKIFRDLRALSEKSDGHGDFGLTDLLGGLLRDHEKAAWMLRSHL